MLQKKTKPVFSSALDDWHSSGKLSAPSLSDSLLTPASVTPHTPVGSSHSRSIGAALAAGDSQPLDSVNWNPCGTYPHHLKENRDCIVYIAHYVTAATAKQKQSRRNSGADCRKNGRNTLPCQRVNYARMRITSNIDRGAGGQCCGLNLWANLKK